MKKSIVLFLLIPAVAIYILEFSIDWCYEKRVKQKFTRIFSHQVDPEIMLFGSSVMYHEFVPRIIEQATGETAYNMGWDGVFFVQYESLIREYLTYEHKCKCIVIGCDFENLGKNGLITRPDLFLAYLNNEYVYESLHEIEPQKMLKARYIPGYTFTLMNKSFYCDILYASNAPDTLLGFDPLFGQFDAKENVDPFNGKFEDRIFSRLKACIADINKKGIKVVLVMTPVYTEGYRKILNAEWIKSKYRSLTNSNVFFLDYTTDSICASKGYFANYSHLNNAGAALFSTMFSRDLLRINGR